MLLGLNFQVEGSFAIKALLLFFYPDYEDMINIMNAEAAADLVLAKINE